MKLQSLFLLLAIVLAMAAGARGQEQEPKPPHAVKVWTAPVEQGQAQVVLYSYSRRGQPWYVLAIYPVSGSSISTVPEQVELIRRAMLEMPSLGCRVKDIGRIVVSVSVTDFQESLNREVERSGKWRGCIGHKSCWAIADVMIWYLDSTGKYGALDKLLRSNGLRIGVIRIEEPAVAMKRTSRNLSPDQVAGTAKISCGGLIFIDVEWKDD